MTAPEAPEDGWAVTERLTVAVECVEFGNSRLDALDGWQGIAWAVTTPGGAVLSVHLTRPEAEAVASAYNNPAS